MENIKNPWPAIKKRALKYYKFPESQITVNHPSLIVIKTFNINIQEDH